MKTYLSIREEVKGMLKPKRFRHTLNVEKEAVKLARIFGEDEENCRLAALLHDCAKGFTSAELIKKASDYCISLDEVQEGFPELLHGPVGAMYAKENFGVINEDILNSIWYHTTGRIGMSLMEKIIYLADLIEESRKFPGIEDIRSLSVRDLDGALVLACNCTIDYIIKSNGLIHPLTIEFRNSLLLRGMHLNG